MFSDPKKIVEELLSKADIKINGNRPWDIKVYNEALYKRVITEGSLGFGEAYVDCWWDVENLDEFFSKVLSLDLNNEINKKLIFLYVLKAVIFNRQTKKRSREVGLEHYDKGNYLFEKMLDKRMVYTCGYWNNSNTLDQAQEAKLDLVCRKLNLQKGQKILDIGCGFGSFVKYATEKYGVNAVGITISKEQLKKAKELTKGMPIEIRLQDYRDITEKFDHIISIGMFEAVGYKNYKNFMRKTHEILKDNGMFLLHTIGGNKSVSVTDPWIDKYIFPNGMLPSIKQIGESIEGLYVMEDWHNFGSDYDLTLMEWYKNFDKNWDKLKEKYDDRFYRMWKYYLLSSAGSFRCRKNQLWQIVLSKGGVAGGYKSIR